jgi:hypothetical protein
VNLPSVNSSSVHLSPVHIDPLRAPAQPFIGFTPELPVRSRTRVHVRIGNTNPPDGPRSLPTHQSLLTHPTLPPAIKSKNPASSSVRIKKTGV